MLSAIGIFCSAHVELFLDRLEDAIGEVSRGLRLFPAGRNDDELVAADARDEIVADGSLKPAGDGAKELVADDVTEYVIGLLEMVEIDAEHGEAFAGDLRLIESARELQAKRRTVGEVGQSVVMGKKGNLRMACQEFSARDLHLVACLAEADSRLAHLILKHVEAFRHLAELVTRIGFDRHDVDRGVGSVEIAVAERRHRAGELLQRPGGEPLGRLAHFGGRVGDHARQDEANADGEQRHRGEDVGKHRHELGMVLCRNGVDGGKIGDAVENEHQHHGAGQLDVERLGNGGKAFADAVLNDAPGIEGGARISESEAEHDGRKAELLEAENGRDQPNRGDDHAERDGAARRAVRSRRVRHVAPEQPRGDVRHADADEVGEIGSGDHPHGIAGNQEYDGRASGQRSRCPRAVRRLVTKRQKSGEEAVVGKLGERARGACQRLQRAVKHVQHDEPDRRGLTGAAEEGSESGAEDRSQVQSQCLRTQDAEPHDGQDDEVDACHQCRGEHGARDVAVGILRLAHMAGSRLEGGCSEADQIEPGHHRGQLAEEALERRRQVIVEGLVPIDVARESGCKCRDEGEGGGGGSDRHREPRHPFDAAEIHEAEQADDGDGDGFYRELWEVPLLNG